MAICPNEHMHMLLQALKDNDRVSVSVYLAEMLLWLAVPCNPLPRLRMAVVTERAMGNAQDALREKAQALRAMPRTDPGLSRLLDDDAGEYDQVADALEAVCDSTEFFLVRP